MASLNLTNKRAFVHLANKNRDEESDIPDKFRVMKILRKHFKLPCLTGEALEIPGKNYARYPDIFVKNYDPQLAILLHGGWHGYGEEVKEYDLRARADYKLLEPGVNLIEIYAAQTDQYSEKKIVEHMTTKEGFIDLDK
jgi:hypothetical protein